jgi:DNA-binding NarL/FixJ family response regulator
MRILIADDNQMIRRAISRLLDEYTGYEVCGEAANSSETIQQVADLRPDLVLLDVSMPGANGLETALLLKQKLPSTKVLIVSQHDPKPLQAFCLEAGADGSVDKARLSTDLIPAIQRVCREPNNKIAN